MGSPFVYEDPLEPLEVLAGRTVELALLRDRIAETPAAAYLVAKQRGFSMQYQLIPAQVVLQPW